jgi:nucleoside-diphosphate-sugar epimerase
MARVLLTGAAGFIGSHVARHVLAEGHAVTAVLRPGDDRWRIADLEARLSIVEADLAELSAVADRLGASRPDVCIHLAWQGWKGTAEDNVASLAVSLALLRLMPAIGCRRFVSAGTCFEYADSPARLSESAPLAPRDVYGACKKALCEISQRFGLETGIRTATARVFYTYGPGENPAGLVPSVIRALVDGSPVALTPGAQVRDYVHVEDIARAIWTVAASDVIGAVNIASGEPVTIAEIARQIGDLLGRPDLVRLGALPYRPGDPMYLVGDPSLLRGHLGWAPRVSMARGLAQSIEWWQGQVSRV